MADISEEGKGVVGGEMGKREQENIRNICIVAHVDHGKTTLADHLIAAAAGGVLHAKMAGKLRYLDDREDEQQRGVTMKSSSIALQYKEHMINLIDSPGHVDFCSEVSSGVRLSDGAVVLVDACEGVHIQTHAVLRQAWLERLTPCLVLNKLDRLILELKLTPLEAYNRMKAIIGEVNNIINAFRSEKYLSDVDSILSATPSSEVDGEGEVAPESIDDDDEPDAFAPERGNVAFASAIDGCAFRIDHFADLFAAKLGANAASLKKALWGDYYYNPKTKKIVGKKAAAGKLKPMFVQFVLEPLWQVYETGMQGKDGAEKLGKIIKSMDLKISPRELQHKDPRVVTQTVVASWLPLADTILSMVIDCLPSPITALPERIPRLLPSTFIPSTVDEEIRSKLESVKAAIETCDGSIEAPCVAFVSKMVAVPIETLPRRGPNGEMVNLDMGIGDTDSAQRECFLAFARVFSGVLSVGSKVYVLSALYDPLNPEQGKNVLEARVEALYMMMGRGLEPKSDVSAGNIVAIRGLGQHILKSGTLSTTPICWPFSRMSFQAAPIVRVAIEPSDPTDMGALARGLRLLNRADPFVEVSVSGSGEHVIAAAGEVHLERCIKDLKERFARIELSVSPPLVEFRETADIEGYIAEVDKTTAGQNEFVEKTTPNGRCVVRVHVTRLPGPLVEVLDGNVELLRDIVEGEGKKGILQGNISNEDPVSVLRSNLLAATTKAEGENKKRSDGDRNSWTHKLERIWALGPHRVGPNVLLIPEPGNGGATSRPEGVDDSGLLVRGTAHLSQKLGLTDVVEDASSSTTVEEATDLESEARNLESSVVSGFQLATASGPLCEEPMWGLAFSVEAFVSSKKDGATGADQYGPFSSQVMATVKDACRAAVLAKRPRIVEAQYFCEVVAPAEHLGSVYGVLGKRRARVVKEEMREGTALFIVHAYMPVSESFGFADELRRKTSGSASPQLVQSHWEALLEDPFFVPRTEEEIEEFGDGSSVVQNTARKLIDAVRRRKGLPVEEKLVQFGSKQRTRARKV
ncbi:hypothetical protein M758_6G077800 [Ceratodon purpureus]|nr:hypothetical protein M758_6G077800 [Ceratodon purpureus]